MTRPAQPSGTTRPGGAAAARAEPRARRTREKVMAAFLEAAPELSLENLTVAELCRRAGVHRVTFYAHWPDIDTLAVEVFAELIDRIADVPDTVADAAGSAADLSATYLRALRLELAGIREHRATFNSLFSSNNDAGLRRHLTAVHQARAELAIEHLKQHGVTVPDGPHGYAAAFIAGGVVAALAMWAAASDDDLAKAAQAIEAQLPAWWPR